MDEGAPALFKNPLLGGFFYHPISEAFGAKIRFQTTSPRQPLPMTLINSTAQQPDRLSVAPMMDWTDRHCRYFHRLLTRHALLYTEMVTTGALLHGDVPRHLRFNAEEHPLALQLGGSEPADLAQAAKLGEQWGYDEINLNCGCPSERVQRGAFGACLMAEPRLVADGVKAMRDVVSVPVTVKHRIGIDKLGWTVARATTLCAILWAPWRKRVASISSCMPATPGCKACHPKKTGKCRRCAMNWCTGSKKIFRSFAS